MKASGARKVTVALIGFSLMLVGFEAVNIARILLVIKSAEVFGKEFALRVFHHTPSLILTTLVTFLTIILIHLALRSEYRIGLTKFEASFFKEALASTLILIVALSLLIPS